MVTPFKILYGRKGLGSCRQAPDATWDLLPDTMVESSLPAEYPRNSEAGAEAVFLLASSSQRPHVGVCGRDVFPMGHRPT